MVIVTIAEATAETDREADLLQAWDRLTAGALPRGLLESRLLRGGEGRWRIETVWESREAIEAMRASTETPAAIEMFAAAGTTTAVSLWDQVRRLDA